MTSPIKAKGTSLMEHRRSQRTRTILQGRVVLNNRFSLLDCVVRDLSETGARVAFAHPVALPSDVELENPDEKVIHPGQSDVV